MQGARYTTVRCHAVDLTCVPPDVGMYALARHWVRGSGLQPPLDIETDTLSEQGAQVRATLRHVQLLALTRRPVKEIVGVLEDKRQQLLRICSKGPVVSDKEWDAM